MWSPRLACGSSSPDLVRSDALPEPLLQGTYSRLQIIDTSQCLLDVFVTLIPGAVDPDPHQGGEGDCQYRKGFEEDFHGSIISGARSRCNPKFAKRRLRGWMIQRDPDTMARPLPLCQRRPFPPSQRFGCSPQPLHQPWAPRPTPAPPSRRGPDTPPPPRRQTAAALPSAPLERELQLWRRPRGRRCR